MNWDEFKLSKRLSFTADVTETVYGLLAQIDSVKKSWSVVQKFQPATLTRLTHSVIVTSTGASNRIEGNRLSDEEVEKLYRNLRIQKFKTRDEQEVAGYLELLELIFENHDVMPLNESLILDLHGKMLRHSKKDDRHRGGYKFGSNRVEAKDTSGNIVGVVFDPTPPHLVEKEMQELLGWYRWAGEEQYRHPLILLGNFLFEYLAIHPFQDGNGRTSRLLTNMLLLQEGYDFVKTVSHEQLVEANKADYYLALNKSQRSWKTEEENVSDWLLFFLKTLSMQADKAFKLITEEEESDLLSENQERILNWALSQSETRFSRKDVIEHLSLAPSTAEKAIKKLILMNKIVRQGEGRATHYRVI